jgi:hypothetical protein
VIIKSFTFSTIFDEAAVFGLPAFVASFSETTPLLNFLYHHVTDEKESSLFS